MRHVDNRTVHSTPCDWTDSRTALQMDYSCLVSSKWILPASPLSGSPTTSSFSTYHLASMDWAKTTSRRNYKYLCFGIWCDLCFTVAEIDWWYWTPSMLYGCLAWLRAAIGWTQVLYHVHTSSCDRLHDGCGWRSTYISFWDTYVIWTEASAHNSQEHTSLHVMYKMTCKNDDRDNDGNNDDDDDDDHDDHDVMIIMMKMMMPIMVTLLSMLIMLGINGRELCQIMIPHIVLLFCIWRIFSFYAYIRKFAISSNAAWSRLWHGLAYEYHSNAKILTVSVCEMDHNLF